MRAAGVAELPEPRMCRGGCAYEPKFDGWRCLAFTGPAGRVTLQSRQGRDLTAYFPEVAAAVAGALPPGTVADGELIVWDEAAGRTSFTALQSRITAGRRRPAEVAGRPAGLVLFDLLQIAGRELLGEPLRERRGRLEHAVAEAPPSLPVCPQTTDVAVARDWLAHLAVTGVEGVVVKDLAGRYRPGRSGWWKVKHRRTTEVIVGGVLGGLADPTVLLLGRVDGDGRLRYVGRTGPLTVAQRAEAAALLTAPAGAHPWPWPLPASWSGRFDRGGGPEPYVPVEPSVVAEVVVDTAYEQGRWRHAVAHLRVRADLTVDDVPPWSPQA
jgi:ATP-dependent DNA ligase